RPHRRSQKRSRASDAPPAAEPAAAEAPPGSAQTSADDSEAATTVGRAASGKRTVSRRHAATGGRGARPADAKRDANRTRPATGKRARARSQPAVPDEKPTSTGLRQLAQPGVVPRASRARKPPPPTGADIVETTFRAAAELAEIGFVAGAQVFRNAVSRLPRP
ncbi:MAG: hypothetical protein JO372_18480, partial [Solirubrobacterales bacterium]|nr:hypothetical protein [Solirubrobacterales bacterium]